MRKNFLNKEIIKKNVLFSVQKVNHNYDLNPKFEQKNFQKEDRTSHSIAKGIMAENKIMKKF